jgi:hypothetical protein
LIRQNDSLRIFLQIANAGGMTQSNAALVDSGRDMRGGWVVGALPGN